MQLFFLRIKKLFDFRLLDRYLNTNPLVDKLPKTNCGNVKYKIYVYPDFTVYPCTCLTDFPIGNLLTRSLKDILSSESSKLFSDYQIKSESACKSCKYVMVDVLECHIIFLENLEWGIIDVHY